MNTWLYILGSLLICFVIVVLIINSAPEYIEDENGDLWPRKDYDKFKNQQKKKK